jgi:hypothetical protein
MARFALQCRRTVTAVVSADPADAANDQLCMPNAAVCLAGEIHLVTVHAAWMHQHTGNWREQGVAGHLGTRCRRLRSEGREGGDADRSEPADQNESEWVQPGHDHFLRQSADDA